eukprot:gnl/TRDRNA2_/TRDRNA2_150646_c1_seq2.p1 gnl/TRDRNA2_/TRDRNA2_150646_c1~~gnl/TRDRNA2_/TRDRNA2_150646_c1_seq2.p1  ORF type:complete len:213 (-),score=48.78 gnl/TRDRNA2_/TRDRNA2_150646_c1_seq2:32-670(-)
MPEAFHDCIQAIRTKPRQAVDMVMSQIGAEESYNMEVEAVVRRLKEIGKEAQQCRPDWARIQRAQEKTVPQPMAHGKKQLDKQLLWLEGSLIQLLKKQWKRCVDQEGGPTEDDQRRIFNMVGLALRRCENLPLERKIVRWRSHLSGCICHDLVSNLFENATKMMSCMRDDGKSVEEVSTALDELFRKAEAQQCTAMRSSERLGALDDAVQLQ